MNVIAFDTETTGFSCALSGGSDEMLQLAIVDEDGRALFNEMFCPAVKRSWPWAEAVHGISPRMVRGLAPFENYRETVQGLIDEADLLIAYNFDFDARFLRSVGISFSGKRHFDVMKEFARLHGVPGRTGRRSYVKLERCAAYYGYAIEGAHDAEADAKATMYCFRELGRELGVR
ncbi:MAG: 3'-5' exonuclease [Clostridiales Family XIII bacterium]|nr:3'-5' exonuclease [Clostridiales Family XIII bacterium]